MLNRLKSTNYTALKGTLLKSKEIRNSLNFVEASKQKESLFHYWYETVHGLKNMLGIKVDVSILEPKTITRSEGKAVRVVDKRDLYNK